MALSLRLWLRLVPGRRCQLWAAAGPCGAPGLRVRGRAAGAWLTRHAGASEGLHEAAECQLHCQPKGHRFYATLAKLVRDGTPCSTGLDDRVCVAGTCLDVGCDGVVGSRRRADVCGVCGGDNGTCQTVSGLLTLRNLSRDYELIAAIPKGAASLLASADGNRLGEHRLRGFLVFRSPNPGVKFQYSVSSRAVHRGGPLLPTSVDEPAPGSGQFLRSRAVQETGAVRWSVALVCSKTCGTALRKDFSHGGGIPPPWLNYTKKMTKKNWGQNICQGFSRDDPWSAWDSGEEPYAIRPAIRTRSRPPSGLATWSPVPSGKSGPGERASERPITEQVCEMAPCSSTWFFSAWSECSVKCVPGVQRRQVFCVPAKSECDALDRPSSQQPCLELCTGSWFVGPWSKCLPGCGNGTRERQVLCVGQQGGRWTQVLPEGHCAAAERPLSTEPCSTPCAPEWHTSAWSTCSSSCGGRGSQTRQSLCLDVGGNTASTDACVESSRPSARRACGLSACPAETAEDRGCRDTRTRCALVVQARLCSYPYFRQGCCASCRRAGSHATSDEDKA
ncbi:hypothetical protein HPB48_019356 [Haemaphysalis longicornis]|uniref:PLAC domain-containing protein n=1 Tax=Haemaphysalis longicornis TaxID=44386 RepID=A0A9J6G676_HAELO|nr:hypothetical protein HPB48_019356 [Haemaphysalis longicornis]